MVRSQQVTATLVRRACAGGRTPLSYGSAVATARGPLLQPTRLLSLRAPNTTRLTPAASAACVLLDQQQRRAASSLVQPPSSSSVSEPERENDGANAVPLSTPDEVEATFRNSVEARTVSNAQLRRYVDQLPAKDYALGLAAVKGAKAGGLRPSNQVYEVLLDLLIQGGQLKASMELYQSMVTKERIIPTPRTYALLMDLCLQRNMPDACQRLFRDMQKRGMRPAPQNYELMLTSLAAETPPKWEEAIAIFDKLTRERKSHVNAKTYNALMKVYMNMEPFDWRVVYNCYHEMRSREPRIPLEWESYLILREALRRGKAGRVRRFMAFLDAWVQTTPLRSAGFVKGVLLYFAAMWVVKSIVGYIFVWYVEQTGAVRDKDGAGNVAMVGESMLPVS